MNIAISSTGPSLDDEVDARFGRCQCFIVTDTDTGKSEVLNNAGSSSGGAGIAAAQMIVAGGIKAVLTGKCGPNATRVLSESGVRIVSGVTGKVGVAIGIFKAGGYAAE